MNYVIALANPNKTFGKSLRTVRFSTTRLMDNGDAMAQTLAKQNALPPFGLRIHFINKRKIRFI